MKGHSGLHLVPTAGVMFIVHHWGKSYAVFCFSFVQLWTEDGPVIATFMPHALMVTSVAPSIFEQLGPPDGDTLVHAAGESPGQHQAPGPGRHAALTLGHMAAGKSYDTLRVETCSYYLLHLFIVLVHLVHQRKMIEVRCN